MEAIYTYQATNSSDSLYLWIGIIISIIAFVGTAFFLRKKGKGREHTQNSLIAMLFFFTGLIAFSTAFFSGWSMSRLGQVVLYQDSMQIGSTDIDYKTIRKISFKEDKSASFMLPGTETRHDFFLSIQCNNNAIHVIPGESYPIGEIKKHIEELR